MNQLNEVDQFHPKSWFIKNEVLFNFDF